MSIEFFPDRIQFSNYSLKITTTGLGVYSSGGRTVNLTSGKITYNIFPGTVNGYTSGGANTSLSPEGNLAVIDKFPFSTDASATTVGQLAVARTGNVGLTDFINGQGYSAIGRQPSGIPAPNPQPYTNQIDKFPFASDANATSVVQGGVRKHDASGQSSNAHGYISGGFTVPTIVNGIDKFSFSSLAVTATIGNLSIPRKSIAGQSSTSHGYASGGDLFNPNSTFYNTIDKFPFATDTNASDVGDLSITRGKVAGNSSPSEGYTAGGDALGAVNRIDKFPFASDANATDVADTYQARMYLTGQSSTFNGYTSGSSATQFTPPFGSVIDKYKFGSGDTGTLVGNLTSARGAAGGHQS